MDIKQLPGVYLMTFIGSSETYVGASQNLRKRIQSHICDFKKGTNSPNLQILWDTFGKDAMQVKVLEYVENPTKVFEREQYYIDNVKPTCNRYTMKEAKTHYLVRTGTLKKKKLESHKGIPNKKPVSEETRQRMRDSAKARVARMGMDHVTKAAAEKNRGNARTTEIRKKISDTKLERYENGEYTHHLKASRDETGKFTKDA